MDFFAEAEKFLEGENDKSRSYALATLLMNTYFKGKLDGIESLSDSMRKCWL